MRTSSIRRPFTGLATLFLVAGLVACGSDGDVGAADGSASAGGPTTSAPPANSGAPSRDGCPLSAEQVSDVLDAVVEEDPALACSFLLADEVFPVVTFIRQVRGLCAHPDDIFDPDLGYEPYNGFPVDAYALADGMFGSELSVCADAPFQISVSLRSETGAPTSESELAVAEAVVRVVLAAEG